MWWAFDIACLWACFKAFGDSPAVGVLVIGYFVGMLANTLPLPGGVGGVDGGMIGMFVAFGVNPATAIVAVLAYRFFAFWLPIGPGRRLLRDAAPHDLALGGRGRGRGAARRAAAEAPPGGRSITTARSATSTVEPMEGFGGFFNDPDFQRRMQEMAEQMQASQSLAWADNAIKLAVDMTVAAINRVNIQGTTEQQAQQIRVGDGHGLPRGGHPGARGAPGPELERVSAG